MSPNFEIGKILIIIVSGPKTVMGFYKIRKKYRLIIS